MFSAAIAKTVQVLLWLISRWQLQSVRRGKFVYAHYMLKFALNLR